MTPPAGIDLLAGSRRLRTLLDEDARRDRDGASGAGGAGARDGADGARGAGGWRALLRLDAGGGARPVSGPLGNARAALARRRARDGAVARALLEEPTLLDGFAGVKLMPQATGLPGEEVLDVLARSGLPLLVHAGILCPPRWLERHLLPRFAGPVILAHLGSWPCSADDLADAVALAGRDARVHLETSGANIGNFVRHAAERVPEKLLFGSNRPMCPPAVQFAHVAASVHDDDTLRALASGNARRLFAHAAPPTAPRAAPPAPAGTPRP